VAEVVELAERAAWAELEAAVAAEGLLAAVMGLVMVEAVGMEEAWAAAGREQDAAAALVGNMAAKSVAVETTAWAVVGHRIPIRQRTVDCDLLQCRYLDTSPRT